MKKLISRFTVNGKRKALGICILTLLAAALVCAVVFGVRKGSNLIFYAQMERYNEQLVQDIRGHWAAVDRQEQVGTLDGRPMVVGQMVTFGRYEQDNNEENGPEPIRWIVLGRGTEAGDDPGVMMIADKVLDIKLFGKDEYALTHYEDSYCRYWLNGDFMKSAFTEEEQGMLVRHTVRMEDIPTHPLMKYDFGPETHDKVFMPNQTLMMRCLAARDSDLAYHFGDTDAPAGIRVPKAAVTDYARAQRPANMGGRGEFCHLYRQLFLAKPEKKYVGKVNDFGMRPVIILSDEYCGN